MLKLVNFREAGELSWGFVVLVTLYWKMCRATQPREIKIVIGAIPVAIFTSSSELLLYISTRNKVKFIR
ncbi:serine/threonine-protein phosphatase 7 long form-like protein [Gossypium australe]|uniref:Serine/threonine-protein phosphatase 7 long form-like protein n=1 Tax=Gossypium australe TaxID=47621 RepID=A0A5B6VM55_9ROSI|nr:serine/threonine-protein phosphatase 7 long form-like protein [Gossypium australe]